MLSSLRFERLMPCLRAGCFLIASLLVLSNGALGQTPPNSSERAAYRGLHEAAARGNAGDIRQLIANKIDPNVRDPTGRTPLHVAAFGSHYEAVRALVEGGGNINALENDRYDVITIAAVKGDFGKGLAIIVEVGEYGSPAGLVPTKQLEEPLRAVDKIPITRSEIVDLELINHISNRLATGEQHFG